MNVVRQQFEGLAELMAYAVTADGKVSPEELVGMQDFLARTQPSGDAGDLFSMFRLAIDKKPDIERIVENIRARFPTYENKLDVYLAIFDMLHAGEFSMEESTALRKIEALLGIEGKDADLVREGIAERPNFAFPLNRNNYLRIDDQAKNPDIAHPEIRLFVLDFGTRFAVRGLSGDLEIAGTKRKADQYILLDPDTVLDVMGLTFEFRDFARLFEMTRSAQRFTIFLHSHEGFLHRHERPALPAISVDGPRITLRQDNTRWLVNDVDRGSTTDLLPGDIVSVGPEAHIRVSTILDSSEESRWPLLAKIGDEFLYVVSSSPFDENGHRVSLSSEPLRMEFRAGRSSASGMELVVHEGHAIVDGIALYPNQIRTIKNPTVVRAGGERFLADPFLRRVTKSEGAVETFEVIDLGFRFPKGWGLRHVDLSARGGELVAIMGASGSGKSTFLNVLLGYQTPTEGKVLVNGKDFHQNREQFLSMISYVPQDDLLMDSLTVEENLFLAGRIRMPHIPVEELKSRVNRVLADIKLLEKRGLQVGNPLRKILSGGQRKRLNIGLELLSDPDLFFLDEPTSGLSSKDSESIIGLLKNLSRKGKLIFVVIHQPSSEIYRMFDTLLLLDTGGTMVWYGPALQALEHFRSYLPGTHDFVECPACGSVNPEIIFDALEQRLPETRSPDGFAGPPRRRFDAAFWRNAYLLQSAGTQRTKSTEPVRNHEEVSKRKRNVWPRVRDSLVSFLTATRRNLLDRTRDRVNLVMTLLAPAILGIVMAGMLRGPEVPYTWSGNPALEKFFFLTTIVFIFFGLMASVNEVIRDRHIIKRERIANFSASRYVLSKFLAFFPFSVLQALIYGVIAAFTLGMPWSGPAYISPTPLMPFPVYFVLQGLLMTQVSYALGLLCSSFLRSQLAAFNLIPLLIIPQILLGGVFVDFKDMPKLVNRTVPEYAQLAFSRWGYEALVAGEVSLNPVRATQGNTSILEDLNRWRASPAFDLPPKIISQDILNDFLVAKIKVEKPKDAEFLRDLYSSLSPGRTQILKNGIADSVSRKAASLMMDMKVAYWGSRFSADGPNQTLENERLSVLGENSGVLRHGVVAWLVDDSSFPSVTREIDTWEVPSAIYDSLVLLIVTLLLHSFSIVRLRKDF